ncbi:MAG TPA: hypothetical protein VGM06_06970 [Polyangiaceae bacterium]
MACVTAVIACLLARSRVAAADPVPAGAEAPPPLIVQVPQAPPPSSPPPPPQEAHPPPPPASGAAPSTDTNPDQLPAAGYVPGYRHDRELGMSPWSPRVETLPGGMTPGFAAPLPRDEWTFRWSGFFTASLQFSENQRVQTVDGQNKTVLHVPPLTIDEYGSFLGTSTVPGQWAQLAFVYGTQYVSANVSLTTWNPTDPTTYYQIGSQQFINNAYLSFNFPEIAGVRLHAMTGYFYNVYGSIGQYGLGMYTNAIIGGVRGVGEDLTAQYDFGENITLSLEDGVMGTRNGMAPITVTLTGQNGAGNTTWPAAWVHHLHAGIEKRGELTLRAHLHYIDNWAQDDRVQLAMDNPNTRQINEAYIKDGRIRNYGFDAAIASSVWGYLGFAASYIQADNAYPVKGTISFGGDGETLTNRWFGQPSGGTGELFVAAMNYGASIGRMLASPAPFDANGPDLAVNAGYEIADSWTVFQPFDSRVRQKFGVDLLYTFLPYMGVGFRVDRVMPNSKDESEDFFVLSPRLVFKTDWLSHDTITLSYGKWFYGADSHPEASTVTPGDRLDDQLFALNAQIYW